MPRQKDYRVIRRSASRRLNRPRLAVSLGFGIEPLETRMLLANIVVTTAADTTANDGLTSLREAIEEANDNSEADTITFDAVLNGSPLLLDLGELTIAESVAITGNGQSETIIDAQLLSRIMHVTGTDVNLTVDGLTLQNGRVEALPGIEARGAAIWFDTTAGSLLTIANSTLQGNQLYTSYARSDGAAVQASAGDVTITGSIFTNNRAESVNGGSSGGALDITSGGLIITDSVLSDNKAAAPASASGGAISIGSGPATINSSMISGNLSSGNNAAGGAIDLASGVLEITGSTFYDNSASGLIERRGGRYFQFRGHARHHRHDPDRKPGKCWRAIFSDAGSATIVNSTISGNTATINGGGGIYSYYSELTIVNSTIAANIAVDDGGGGVYWYNADYYDVDITIDNSIIAGNIAETANDFTFGTGSPVIHNSLIGDNEGTTLAEAQTADSNGNFIGSSAGSGVIDPLLGPLAFNGGPTQTHALLAGSLAIDTGDNTLAVASSSASLTVDQRGAPFARIVNTTVDMGAFERAPLPVASLLVDNPTDESDGDFSVGDVSLREAVELANANVGVADTITFDAAIDGTPLLLELGQLQIADDVTISGNGRTNTIIDAQQMSRVIDIDAAVVDTTLEGLTIQNGRLLRNNPRSDNLTFSGAGIRALLTGTLTISDSTISGNRTTNEAFGGGLFLQNGDVTISASTFSNNYSEYGGAVYANADSNVTVTNSTFAMNSVSDDGGAIYAGYQGTPTVSITGSTFTQNTAQKSGGAVQIYDGQLSLVNITLSGNMATENGGAVYLAYGQATITGSTISGNSASSDGGGIWSANDGTTTITGSTISGNSAGRNGGGIWSASYGTTTITSSTISGNSASINGGGIWSYQSGATTITGNTISGNSAGSDGGGIWSYQSGTTTITGSTISGNSANDDGGGIWSRNQIGGTTTITGSTISGNSASSDGGGIYSTNDGTTTITGSTISGNSASSDGGGIWSANYGTATSSSTILAGNTADTSGPDLFQSYGTLAVTFSLIGNNAGSGLTESQIPDADGNLIGGSVGGIIDPLLGPLANNGGPTQTHALLAGSLAIDAGDPAAMAGVGDTPEFDQRGMPFARVSAGRIDMGAVELIDGDFNDDGFYTYTDIDELVGAIAPGTNDTTYDLNSDGLVDLTDRDIWLAVAGAANLDTHDPFLLGDANLDGVVDGQDFIIWNANKFSPTGLWSRADWNADGLTDGQDFIIWNAHKFQASGSPLLSVLHQPPDLRESKIEPLLPPSVGVPHPIASTAIRRIDDAFADLHRREERGEPRGDADMFGGVISESTMKPYFF